MLDNPTGFMTGPRAGDPLSLALSDAVSHAGQAGLLPGDIADAVVSNDYHDSGVTHVYLVQSYNGLPVYNTNLGIHIKDGGELLDIGGEFVPGLSASDGGLGAIPTPIVSPAQAVQIAAENFGYPAGSPTVSSGPSGILRQTVLSDPQASDLPITAKLVYIYTGSGVRPSWEFSLQTPDGQHWYDVAVDTQTGAVTFQNDWQDNFAPASYDVYPIPLRSPTDATPAPPGDGRTVLVNPYNPVTSPAGWQNDGTPGGNFTDTRGNNVDAQADLFATNDSTIRPDAGPSLRFVSPIDFTQRPQAYLNAAVTNLFYVDNWLHDVHAVYGFDEASGNFQQTNFTGQGVGGDPLQADAQDGSGFDNANMATPPDGQSPRMQMYIWPLDLNNNVIDPARDGDLDNEIMLHEYGHGVSNRLTGGPADSNALDSIQSGGMGEGWSDWWATMFTQTVNSTQNAAYPTGTYVLNEPVNGGGIRSFPYSFNMSIDKHTFDDYGTTGTSAISGLARSTEVHATGEIWTSALWDMNWLLINKYGFDPDLTTGYDPNATGGPTHAGNKLALQLVMDALKLQPANPSFTQARDAILLADRNLTGGANQREIWTAFARRGLGYTAFSASADDTSINIAFDMPPAAASAPAIISQLITTPSGGPNQIAKVTGATAPSQITLTFSTAMDPLTFSVANSIASFTGPGGLDLKPSITSINWITGNTQLQINFTPPAAPQGQYVMVLGPDIRNKLSNPTAEQPLDQNLNGVPGEATADQYTASFAYDPTVLQVIGVTPTAGSAAANSLTTISLTFNEPIDPASISTGSLQLSSGTITGVSLSAGNTVANFTVSGLSQLGEIPVYMSMKYGAVTDSADSPADEFPVQVFNSNFTLDITSAALPTPMAVDGPTGWRSYQSMFNLPTQVNVPGDKDDFTISMEAGSQLSVAIDSVASGLQPVIKVFDPSNNPVGTATATGAGKSISLSNLPISAAGVYTVEVSGVGTTTGAYRVRVLADTAVEAQAFGGAVSNTQATAQPLGSAFETIAPGVDMANVYGKTFASGALSTEVEPNDTLASANDTTRNFVSVPTSNLYQLSFTGVITKASDQNWFKIGTMQIGDILTVTVSGAWGWPGGGFMPDSFVQLVNSAGPNPPVTSDDNSGPINATLGVGDSLIYRFPISQVDTYWIEVEPSPFTFIPKDIGAYRVGVLLENTSTAPTTGGTATNNTGTSNTQGTAIDNSGAWKKVQYNSVVNGTIGVIGDTDFYKYTFAAGDVVTLHVAASGGWSPTVNLLDSNGLPVVIEDGTSVGMLPNSDVYAYTIKSAGTYYVEVGARGSGGAYTVTVDLSTSGTPLTPIPSAVDYYLLPTLTAGQVLTVGIDQLTAGGNAAVDLIYHNPVTTVDTVVASGKFGPTNFNRVINGFVVPTTGATYYIRVTDAAPFEYLLSILRNGLLEQESNDSVNAPQAIGAATTTPTTVVGGITPGDADWYSFTVDAASAAAGNALVIQTSTPGDLPGEPQNTLNPELEVYRPDGTLLLADDNSAPDGRNAFIRVTAGTAGTYKVRVLGVGGTTGAYVLTLSTSPNQAPTSVVPGGPYTINEGNSLTLTTSAVDPDHDPLTFSWDINGDGVFGDAVGANPTLTWAQLVALGIADGPATFNVQVEVTDPYHPPVTSGTTTLTVNNTSPTATLTNGGSVPEGSAGLVTLTNQFDPSPVDTTAGFHYSYDFNNDGTWDLGDGTYAGSAGVGASVPVPGAFLPDGPGTYTVKARIIDKDGGFTDYTTTITVTNVPPTATLSNGGSVPEGSPGTVTFSNQSDPSPVDTAAGFR
jgi:extracellular elastinolytic metalloproteinase